LGNPYYTAPPYTTCVHSSEQDFQSISFPYTEEQLHNITFTFYNGKIYTFYPDYCTFDSCQFSCYNALPIPLDLVYNSNGSYILQMTGLNITCDEKCLPNNTQSSYLYYCYSPSVVTCEVNSVLPLSFEQMPSLYSYLNLDDSTNLTLSYNSGEFINNTLSFNPQYLFNDFAYTDQFFFEFGCIPFNDLYINVQFCNSPYCITTDGIYPTNYLNIISISDHCLGCMINVPSTFYTCNTLKRSFCEGISCNSSFEVTNDPSNTTIILEANIIHYLGNTYYGFLNISESQPEPPVSSLNTIPEPIFWAGFGLSLFLYLICIGAILVYCLRKCCSPFALI